MYFLHPVVPGVGFDAMEDREAELSLSQIFSKRFVHCIAGKAQVGIVISDLEVKPKQPEQ